MEELKSQKNIKKKAFNIFKKINLLVIFYLKL